MSSPIKTPPRRVLAGLAPLLFVFVFSLRTVAAPASEPAAAGLQVGASLPALETYALEGAPPVLAGKVVLLDFWASWCAPCKASFPVYAELQTDFSARGFTVLAVSVDTKAAPYEAFLKRNSPGFPTLRDAGQKLAAAVRPPAMPTCYLLDRHGVVRLVHRGFRGEEDARLLRAEIEKLLDEKP